MTEPTAIDGSDGPLVTRRLVVWRRLEPGDARTPGTELAPESPHLEAQILEVGIAETLFEDLKRLEAMREAAHAVRARWTTRYEPAGVLFTVGGAVSAGALLQYVPPFVLPFTLSLALLGVGVGFWTRSRKTKSEREAERRWRAMPEHKELASIEKRLLPRWERFATKLRENTEFRADVRVGDIHEADRLVSLDPARIAHPDTWRPDAKPTDVRYGWRYADGRVIEKEAELEDTDAPEDDDGADEPDVDEAAEPAER